MTPASSGSKFRDSNSCVGFTVASPAQKFGDPATSCQAHGTPHVRSRSDPHASKHSPPSEKADVALRNPGYSEVP